MVKQPINQLPEGQDAVPICPEEFTDANFTPLVQRASGDWPILNYTSGLLID